MTETKTVYVTRNQVMAARIKIELAEARGESVSPRIRRIAEAHDEYEDALADPNVRVVVR